MMEIIGAVVSTLALVGLAFYAWWAIRPPKARRDDRSREQGGNMLEPLE